MAINVDAVERRMDRLEQAAGVDIKFPRLWVRYVSNDPGYEISMARANLDGTDIVIHRQEGESEEDFIARAKAEIPGDSGVVYFDMRDCAVVEGQR